MTLEIYLINSMGLGGGGPTPCTLSDHGVLATYQAPSPNAEMKIIWRTTHDLRNGRVASRTA